jgi:hypothetical protein
VYSLEYSFDLLKRKEQTALNIEFVANTTWTNHGKAVGGSLPKMGWFGPGGGVVAPLVWVHHQRFWIGPSLVSVLLWAS